MSFAEDFSRLDLFSKKLIDSHFYDNFLINNHESALFVVLFLILFNYISTGGRH